MSFELGQRTPLDTLVLNQILATENFRNRQFNAFLHRLNQQKPKSLEVSIVTYQQSQRNYIGLHWNAVYTHEHTVEFNETLARWGLNLDQKLEGNISLRPGDAERTLITLADQLDLISELIPGLNVTFISHKGDPVSLIGLENALATVRNQEFKPYFETKALPGK